MAGIYIHIPFCKTKCPYCDFFSVTDTSYNQQLIQSIQKELRLQQNYLGDQKIETIYFGGGTPSFINLQHIEAIIDQIYKFYSVVNTPEITIECNPDDLNTAYLKGLKKIADFRINLGVQSFKEDELGFLQRRHSVNKSLDVLTDIFDVGFNNVGLDLIYGLPGSNLVDLEANLKTAFHFPIRHLSAYHLTIEPLTPLYKQLKNGSFKEIPEELSRRQFFLLIEMANGFGFEHYEISNFAKDGAYSKHNTSYWKGIPYLGVGPSAHSFDGNKRHWNVSGIKTYLQFIENDQLACDEEQLSMKDRFNEYLMVSLRTKWGVDMNYLQSTFPSFIDADFREKLTGYQEKELIYQKNERIYLSDEGQFLSDRIIMDLFKTE